MSQKRALITAIIIACVLISTTAGVALHGEVTGGADAVPASTENAAPTRSDTERPRRIRQNERDKLEEESAIRNAVGDNIERQMEQAADAGVDLSFEEAKAQAEAQLFQASASYGHASAEEMTSFPREGETSFEASPFDHSGGNPFDAGSSYEPHGSEGYEDDGMLQRVCFRSDGKVTNRREECDTDQSGHFGFESQTAYGSEQGHGYEGGYDVPSYEDVSGYMNQQFTTDMPPTFSQGDRGDYGPAMHDPGQTIGMTPASQMTFILTMMDDIMNTRLPKVFALFEGGGMNATQPRVIFQRAAALFNELQGPCRAGTMEFCFRLSEVADIMMRMRPIMEKAIMESGNWQIGMQIGQIMEEGMEGMGPPPGMHGGPPSGMGNYGPPPGMNGGYGPPPGYDQMDRNGFY